MAKTTAATGFGMCVVEKTHLKLKLYEARRHARVLHSWQQFEYNIVDTGFIVRS